MDPVTGDELEAVDLYDTNAPAASLNGTAYEEILFGKRAVELIEKHDTSVPMSASQ